ncbi:MAG: hypothetical protein GY898_05365 [Proteobacteria bacterium]|nr:hypothetical protein [Pseudomonadota bacterium]
MSQALPLPQDAIVDARFLPELEHLAWLMTGPVRLPDGGVLSWFASGGSGFPYTEAEGLLLSLHAEARAREPGVLFGPIQADGRRLANRLEAALDSTGAVLHRGGRYAFDTAIAAAALRRWKTVDPTGPDPAPAVAFVRSCLERRIGQEGLDDDGHWSRTFGPHLLKAALALPGDPLVEELAEHFASICWEGGWFTCHDATDHVYPHAHAYALEGLLALRAQGSTAGTHRLAAGLESLLRAAGSDRLSSDVLAQTIRICLAMGIPSGDPRVADLDRQLRARSAPGGGIRYSRTSADINAWATTFAVQARRWIRIGASPLHLA